MQIVRFQADGASQLGLLQDGDVYAASGDIFGDLTAGARVGALDELVLLPPVMPSKLIAIGLNYRDHIEQDTPGFAVPENPIIFLKPPSALVGHGAPIVLPRGAEQVEAEAELAIVIGRRCRNVAAADAESVILGYTPSNDVSARDYQYTDGQWVRAKGFDSFAPIGPAIVTGVSPADLAITSRINGQVRQSSRTSYLIFDVPYLIEFVSRVMTLEPGDVIMTGTPAGPPKLAPGDGCEIEIEGLGVLRNPVRNER
jgi:2-keto-4-pentenoate hydratase/2-oxohepta-3-ene-1,7-dioic acid hydratase in catechol pathway